MHVCVFAFTGRTPGHAESRLDYSSVCHTSFHVTLSGNTNSFIRSRYHQEKNTGVAADLISPPSLLGRERSAHSARCFSFFKLTMVIILSRSHVCVPLTSEADPTLQHCPCCVIPCPHQAILREETSRHIPKLWECV